MTVPVLTDLDEMVQWLTANVTTLTADVWNEASGRVGGTDTPALLYDLWHSTVDIPPDVLGHAAADAWTSAEYPAQAVDAWLWEEWFDSAGFMVDGKPGDRPTEPITLYRGAVDEDGMSWTSDRAVAERFATGRLRGRPEGRVWERTFHPHDLLAYLTDRAESEYVTRDQT